MYLLIQKLTFPDLSQKVKDQLITYARSHKVEHRLTLHDQIILDWITFLFGIWLTQGALYLRKFKNG